MTSTCSGAPALPSPLTISLKDPQDMNPLELFLRDFEPAVIDGALHGRFRPALHQALEFYSAHREQLRTSVPLEDSRVILRDEQKTGLDG